ncbi:Protein CBG27424 [Caenorhabditis briggsae]|uniref:Uncharacterized protein n=2 Tax=Caenorhabditis briggsae TaxID=6238 RepID=A0AAE9CT29_CAEBR|nr:Protein CBG27424 [Caenorhabditis briggsae]ULT79833.1 hypothetical protein L3Y34_010429 [Caenorhabditis briggsae]CAS00231.1 Protein CBG27424 [Caenorhabditis briggsae]
MKIFGQTVIRLPKEPISPPKESDATWRAKFYERSLSPEFTEYSSNGSATNNARYEYSSDDNNSDDDDEYASDSNMSHSDTDTSAANSESEGEEHEKN